MKYLYRFNYLPKQSDKIRRYVRDTLGVKEYDQHGIHIGNNSIHIGNNCVVGLPSAEAKEMVKKFGGFIDNKRPVFEACDLKSLHTGDRVIIEYYWDDNAFIPIRDRKGTVIGTDDTSVTIRAYRKHKMGWRIKIGDTALLKKERRL